MPLEGYRIEFKSARIAREHANFDVGKVGETVLGLMMFFTSVSKEQLQAQAVLRRICDLSSPNLRRADELRGDTRQNRTLPVLVTPWSRHGAVVGAAMTALTRDISDRGLSITLAMTVNVRDVAVGLWLKDVETEPWFFLGSVKHNAALGGGFWSLGIEIIRRLKPSEAEALVEIAKQRL